MNSSLIWSMKGPHPTAMQNPSIELRTPTEPKTFPPKTCPFDKKCRHNDEAETEGMVKLYLPNLRPIAWESTNTITLMRILCCPCRQ